MSPQDEVVHLIREKPFARVVRHELARARSKHPQPLHSLHEGFAVLVEEVHEAWKEVTKRQGQRDLIALAKELVQVSAMAQRMAEDCILNRRNNTCS